MDQEIITTPTLRPTLEEVRNRFETWRKNKEVRSRIPDALWQAAVEVCKDHSILQVSRALRLNYNDLKNRVHDAAEKIGVAAPSRCSDFVEVDFGASITPSECVVEMKAPNGAKMKMYFKGQQRGFDPVGLSRAFWRQGL
jgi:hypothetical protein